MAIIIDSLNLRQGTNKLSYSWLKTYDDNDDGSNDNDDGDWSGSGDKECDREHEE